MSLIIASFKETREIAKKVSRALNASYMDIGIENFPDSEFHLKFKKNVRGKVVVIVNSMAGDPNDKVIETVLAAGVAKDYHAKKVILVATYLPYLRQDKHFEKYDSFSAKHIVELFKDFDKIFVVDPHLHRIKRMNQLSNKAENITSNRVIADFIRKNYKNNFEIVGPDSESEQWNKPIANILGKKVIILNKKRFSAEKIKQESRKMEKNLVMIDDIISTGKTLEGALRMAKKQHKDSRIICIGIHGLLVENADKRITKYARLVTTNTVPNKYAKIDVSPAIAEKLKKLK